MLPQGILDQVDNDGKIILLTRKLDNLKTLRRLQPAVTLRRRRLCLEGRMKDLENLLLRMLQMDMVS